MHAVKLACVGVRDTSLYLMNFVRGSVYFDNGRFADDMKKKK